MTTFLPPEMLDHEQRVAMATELGLPLDYFEDGNFKNPEYLAKLDASQKALHDAREARLPKP